MRSRTSLITSSLPSAFLAALLLAGCGGASEPASAPVASASPASSSAPAAETTSTPSAPELDLSTPEKARHTIYEVLKRDDKEAFRRCVSKRMLERQKDQFDLWYGVWKAAADKGPEKFDKVTVTQEDGAYKLDEN
jgi:hypothetical protein